MLTKIFKPLSLLPLPFIHKLGKGLGWVLHITMTKGKQHAFENMSQSKLFPNRMSEAVRKSFFTLGMAILETSYIWNSTPEKVKRLMQDVHGWQNVEQGIAANKGIIFLAPHMGCFEITSLYYALHHPITVMYRPPKQKWLNPIVNTGRSRDNITLAEANASGVRKLLQALKRGEAIGILPDQIPRAGEGEWADFFGKPAYTMTLASKLAEKTGATIIMAFAERLPNGNGFDLHLNKADSVSNTTLLNQAIEIQIKQCPEQYYWSYHRYKVSRKSKNKLFN